MIYTIVIRSDKVKNKGSEKMKISDLVAEYIVRLLDEEGGNAEIKRNELAVTLGCVPSQINYVITSRFTPEQGYIVESRRGGGGYIRITRVAADRKLAVMHIISSLKDSISATAAEVILDNMTFGELIPPYDHALISSALSDKAYSSVPQELRDALRASVMKNMLMTLIMTEKQSY